MEKTNLLTLVVTLTVGIILAGSLLMPVLNDATTTEKTFANSGYYYMTDTSEHTYEFDGSKWTVDDVSLNHTLAGVNVVATDTFFIRDVGQVRGAYNISGITSCELTFNNGTVTGTYTTTGDPQAVNWTYSEFYGATPTKDAYILSKNTNTPIAYINGDSEVYGYGTTSLGGAQNIFQVTGNLDDGATVVCPNSSVTVSNISFNATPVEGYIDLYTYESVTFTATLSGTDYAVTYNIVVLPSEVTAELAQHLDAGEIALINALPVIVIIGLVLAGVGAIFVRNRD